MFLTGMTRPDIPCSGRKLIQRVTYPCMKHWRELHVLSYLVGTVDVGINHKKSTDDGIDTPVGYSDSDWGQVKEAR